MHALLHSVPPTLQQSESEVTQSCPTLCDPVDCSPPDSSVHGILQAKVLQEYWSGLPFPSPGDLPDPGIKPRSPNCRQMLSALSHQGSNPAAGHHQPTPTHASAGNSWRLTGKSGSASCVGTQIHPSTENWIKYLLSMALPIRTRPSFPLSQSLPSGSFHTPLSLLQQRADRLKNTITEN